VPYVGVDLSIVERDAKTIRGNKPFVFINCKTGQGVDKVAEHIIQDVLVRQHPETIPM